MKRRSVRSWRCSGRVARCVRSAPLVATLGAASACSTHYAQTAAEPLGATSHRDGGAICGASLASRLTVTQISVDADIRYQRPGYNFIPEDEPIAFSVAPDGSAQVAWLDDAGAHVHVTPLDASLTRSASDVVVDGLEVGGFVAQRDGFALLTRRTDPGTPLPDPLEPGTVGKAAIFVRVRDGVEETTAPLTGTASVTTQSIGPARDCTASPLHGRLEWNGAKYGAYFAMLGCEGDVHASYYGDKLAYLDDGGRAISGGWGFNCSIDEGLRLVPEADVFTSLCLADRVPFPGLDLVIAGRPPVELAPELSADGYSAGQFGSVVKMNDGTYVVAWLSRGFVEPDGAPGRAAKRAPDIAFLRLDASYAALGPVTWLSDTDDIAEANLHVAPYGPDRLIMLWDAVDEVRCGPQTCLGHYAGTHARLMDARGNFVSDDALISAVPNTDQDLRVFANGDVGWAFVSEMPRSYAEPLFARDGGAIDGAPSIRTLSVARLAYCP